MISSHFLSGLLETEPLSFQVINGSDHMRLFNVENTAMSLRVPSSLDLENEGMSTTDNPIAKIEEKNLVGWGISIQFLRFPNDSSMLKQKI